MRKHGILGYALLMVLGLAWLVGQPGVRSLSADQAGGLPALEKRVAALEALVKSLQQTNTSQAADIAALKNRLDQAEVDLTALDAGLQAVEVKTAPISVVGTDFVITGKNVFIVDGSGATKSESGLGNLTVGYNVLRAVGGDARTGTHNLILGDRHNYTSYGGLVAGGANQNSRPHAPVTRGGSPTPPGDPGAAGAGGGETARGARPPGPVGGRSSGGGR